MKKTSISLLLLGLFCIPTFGDTTITVNPAEVIGPIKPMNAVNNGPVKAGNDQTRGNFSAFRNAGIPFARTHDAAFCESYGGSHIVDILNIFPDFDKNVNDPKSYDFVLTDVYLKTIQDAGTKVYFRLGQKIEHPVKKYGIYPPKDYKKWAQICEHIIRHYTEGWANGKNWDIQYWEIWNEPDLDIETWKTNPRCWGGTEEQFQDFFVVAAKYLKKCFPNLKIGGPALAGNEKYADRLLARCKKDNVPLDFFSWHIYSVNPQEIAAKADRMRQMMDKHGYDKAESILNEWNYVKGWTHDYPYSVKMMNSLKGAAFTSAVMSACQSKPLDLLMYYDARYGTIFNALFDFVTFAPTSVYYPFYAWTKLAKYGTQVKAEWTEKDLYVTAAKNKDGKLAINITRFNNDDNEGRTKLVKLQVGKDLPKEVVGHLTDDYHMFTEIPLDIKNGDIEIYMEPNSFILIEL